MNTLAACGLEEPFFQLCCCVSVFWFWREIGFGVTCIFRVKYSCGVVLVFWFWQELVFGFAHVLIVVYNTLVRLCKFFGCGGKEFSCDLRKILIGFLYGKIVRIPSPIEKNHHWTSPLMMSLSSPYKIAPIRNNYFRYHH
jgi:hypothetical protein